MRSFSFHSETIILLSNMGYLIQDLTKIVIVEQLETQVRQNVSVLPLTSYGFSPGLQLSHFDM